MSKQLCDAILAKINYDNKELAEQLASEVLKKMEEHEGMTIKDAIGISDKALEEVYSLAYNFYNHGKYREAISLFELLTGASPKTYKYVLGLAASYHQIQAYEEAFAGFYIALHLDPANPIPVYYAADCCLKQNLYEEALEFAEMVVEICEKRPEYKGLKERCELIIHSLKCNK